MGRNASGGGVGGGGMGWGGRSGRAGANVRTYKKYGPQQAEKFGVLNRFKRDFDGFPYHLQCLGWCFCGLQKW
jgi:hypothetical protein